jgi:hypothetical protein
MIYRMFAAGIAVLTIGLLFASMQTLAKSGGRGAARSVSVRGAVQPSAGLPIAAHPLPEGTTAPSVTPAPHMLRSDEMTEGLPTDMRRFGMPGRLHNHNRSGPGFTFAVPYGYPSAFGFPNEYSSEIPYGETPDGYSDSCCDADTDSPNPQSQGGGDD